jgi:hypothetical protein
MGKILDTITVEFKGDTSDLEKKAKIAADLADKIKNSVSESKDQVDALNDSINETVDTLTEAVEVTQGLKTESQQAAEAVDQQILLEVQLLNAQEKTRKESEKATARLGVTKRGANEVADAIQGIVKQFAGAALGAFTVAGIINATKQTYGEVLDAAQAGRRLNISPSYIDARGRAVKEAGGDQSAVVAALQALSIQTGGLQGAQLQKVLEGLLLRLSSLPQKTEQQRQAKESFAVALEKIGIPRDLTSVYKLPETPARIAQLEKQNPKFDVVAKAFLGVHRVNTAIGTALRDSAFNIIGNEIDKEKTHGLAVRPSHESNTSNAANSPSLWQLLNQNQNSNKSSSVNINTINVNAPNATDSVGIVQSIENAFKSEIAKFGFYNDGRAS